MDPIAIIILSIIIADLTVHGLADVLNMRAWRQELPRVFRDVFDATRYERSLAYQRQRTRLEWGRRGADLVLLLTIWFGGGFSILDQWIQTLHMPAILDGLLYIGSLLLLRALIQLPFDIVHTFVIEARFGFNRTTVGTFVGDRLKVFVLVAALGGPLLALILWFFETSGPLAWWLSWVVFCGFVLGFQFAWPTWILPLFNRLTPLQDAKLQSALLDYVRSIHFPVRQVMQMDGSKRSGKGNAFFAGFGRHRRIVLFDTLIDRYTAAQLVAVLAHEIGHFKHRHLLKMGAVTAAHAGMMFYLLHLCLKTDALYQTFFMQTTPVYAGLVFFSILFSPADTIVGVATKAMSRRHEYEADAFSVKSTGDHRPMADVLKQMAADHLSPVQAHPLYVALYHTHPPVADRLSAIEDAAMDTRRQGSSKEPR